jgi:hypothetical protein
MTQKEKAKELIESIVWGDLFIKKQIALITVEHLIKYLPSSAGNPPNLQENEYDSEWWVKVKKEIEICD